MRQIKICGDDPTKYLPQKFGTEGISLVVDINWKPSPDVEYITSINISDDSTDSQAMDEVLNIWEIHSGGSNMIWVSGTEDAMGLVHVLAFKYKAKIKEYTQ